MALPLWLLVSVGGRHFQCPRPALTLESLGPSQQRRHKSWVSLSGAHGVLGTPHGEVRNKDSTAQLLSSKIHQVQLFFIIFIRPTLNAMAAQVPPSYIQSFHSFIQDHQVAHPPGNLTNFHHLQGFGDSWPYHSTHYPLHNLFYLLHVGVLHQGHVQSVSRFLGLPNRT